MSKPALMGEGLRLGVAIFKCEGCCSFRGGKDDFGELARLGEGKNEDDFSRIDCASPGWGSVENGNLNPVIVNYTKI